MIPHLLVRSGARVGELLHLRTSRVRIGRRPDLEVVLDAERDLEVSALHAELTREGGRWLLRDLGSRNGTFLNGRPVKPGPLEVRHGGEIRLGPRGPLLELRLEHRTPAPRGASVPPPTGPAPVMGSATQQVRVRVRAETRRLRWAVAGLAALLGLVVVGFFLVGAHERAEWARERERLESSADSLLAAGERSVRSLEGELGELAHALDLSRAELEDIRAAMDRQGRAGEGAAPPPAAPPGAPGGSSLPTAPDRPASEDETEALRQRLRAVTAALERQQLAASLDFESIQEANRRAVALLFVEHENGTVATGTAFAVEANGTLIASRHVLLGAEGMEQPTRVGVQFTDSRQVFPARILAASTEWDLAALRLENLVGEVPTVAGINLRPDTLASGTPLATLGFPLGGDVGVAPGEERPLARPLLSAGVLLGQAAGPLEIHGYGEPGASGSPIFDRDGVVAGVLFGGRRDGDDRVLVAVPAPAIAALLRAIREGGG